MACAIAANYFIKLKVAQAIDPVMKQCEQGNEGAMIKVVQKIHSQHFVHQFRSDGTIHRSRMA